MKRTLLLLGLMSLAGCATTGPKFSKDMPRDAQPLYVTSLGSVFAVQGIFDGTFEVHRDFIDVKLAKSELRIQDYATYHGRRKLTVVRIGLAHSTQDGKWAKLHTTNAYVLNTTVQPGERVILKETKARVPISESLDLSQHWFLVEIESIAIDNPPEKQIAGVSNAHSARDVFLTAVEVRGPRVGTDE